MRRVEARRVEARKKDVPIKKIIPPKLPRGFTLRRNNIEDRMKEIMRLDERDYEE